MNFNKKTKIVATLGPATSSEEIIKKMMKGENINLDQSGLSKREWNELMEAFELKDMMIISDK